MMLDREATNIPWYFVDLGGLEMRRRSTSDTVEHVSMCSYRRLMPWKSKQPQPNSISDLADICIERGDGSYK
jgi:hypothetical protein